MRHGSQLKGKSRLSPVKPRYWKRQPYPGHRYQEVVPRAQGYGPCRIYICTDIYLNICGCLCVYSKKYMCIYCTSVDIYILNWMTKYCIWNVCWVTYIYFYYFFWVGEGGFSLDSRVCLKDNVSWLCFFFSSIFSKFLIKTKV